MARQLSLLETRRTWALSETTREVGRRGVAEARACLQAAIAARAGEGGADRSPGRRDTPARRQPSRRTAPTRTQRPHAA
ncbi:MAG TPA: hypothetical protein VFV32_05670 [Acidimicrobiales bacterium]|nr:hypothetical protein [Acidimicrobiales bacterium]